MPSYQSNHIGIAMLIYFLLWSVPAGAQRADADKPLSLIGDAAILDPATAAPNTVQQQDEANAEGDQTLANDADQSAMPAADNSLANTSAAYAQVSLGRRKISEVGLAAIGVGASDSNERGLDSMIWRGTSASDAVFLLEKAVGSGKRYLSSLCLG